MWQYHDKKMKELRQIYNRVSKQTQNKLQEVFDSIDFDFNNLYSIADNKKKNRINAYIEEWKDKGLLTGDFGMLANNIYKRSRVKNSEILELLIYGAYVEEQSKLNELELKIFKEDINYYYQQGQKEVNNKKRASIIPDALFLAMLDMPNVKGYVYNDYLQAILRYNAEQLYRQVVIDIQQEKPLEINSGVYKSIIKKQLNQKLNINEDKISGDIDLTLIGMNNRAKVEGIYSFDKNARVKFVSVEDNKTTEMCKSLDGQIFKVHDWNEFERYSHTNGRKTKYKCYGLIQGLNLPPIDDHFHWCRSTIVYNINTKYEDINFEYEDITSKFSKIHSTCEVVQQNYYIDNDGNKYKVNNKHVFSDATEKEKEVAKLLGKIYGGKVNIIPRVTYPKGIKTPDYIINGIKFDLKEIKGAGKNALDSAIKSKSEQASNFVFDITNAKLDYLDILEQVKMIYSSKHRSWLDTVILIKNNQVQKIFKRKIKKR